MEYNVVLVFEAALSGAERFDKLIAVVVPPGRVTKEYIGHKVETWRLTADEITGLFDFAERKATRREIPALGYFRGVEIKPVSHS